MHLSKNHRFPMDLISGRIPRDEKDVEWRIFSLDLHHIGNIAINPIEH